MVSAERHHYTFREYLELEAKSDRRHEYFDGQIFAMAGGSPEHGRLAAMIIGLFHQQLRGRPCVTFTSDVRIRVQATGFTTYPDVSVVCGELERDGDDRDAVVNPTVLVEVLSPTTEEYDREDKFSHYRRIASLKAYVLVSQREHRVEVFTRNVDGTWTLRDVERGVAKIDCVGCDLPLGELYRDPLAT
jgi:Uma2 family endonuclease